MHRADGGGDEVNRFTERKLYNYSYILISILFHEVYLPYYSTVRADNQPGQLGVGGDGTLLRGFQLLGANSNRIFIILGPALLPVRLRAPRGWRRR